MLSAKCKVNIIFKIQKFDLVADNMKNLKLIQPRSNFANDGLVLEYMSFKIKF